MSASPIYFEIKGNPKALKRHRTLKNGRSYDPSFGDKKSLMLQSAKHKPKTPLQGDIFARLTFVLKRPKFHFRTGKYKGQLKDKYKLSLPSKKPDIDNLIKLVLDSLTGFIDDDRQIVRIQAEKIYCDKGEEPHTEIYLEEL